jgi:hypothetical protein
LKKASSVFFSAFLSLVKYPGAEVFSRALASTPLMSTFLEVAMT